MQVIFSPTERSHEVRKTISPIWELGTRRGYWQVRQLWIGGIDEKELAHDALARTNAKAWPAVDLEVLGMWGNAQGAIETSKRLHVPALAMRGNYWALGTILRGIALSDVAPKIDYECMSGREFAEYAAGPGAADAAYVRMSPADPDGAAEVVMPSSGFIYDAKTDRLDFIPRVPEAATDLQSGILNTQAS